VRGDLGDGRKRNLYNYRRGTSPAGWVWLLVCLGLGELGAVKKAIQKNISDFVYISIGIT